MSQFLNQTYQTNDESKQYIFISDIHGNLETLSLIKKAQQDFPDALLVCGGDYIDGRANIKDVLDFLIQQKERGAIILKGNHEQMMLNYANGKEHQEGIWFYNGGRDTLQRLFGKVALLEEIRQSKYYQFLSSLAMMYETPNFIFVHAGVRPDEKYNDPNSYSANLDIYHQEYTYDFYRIWVREKYWYSDPLKKVFAHNHTTKTIVTGHTPTSHISGEYENGARLATSILNPVRVIQYEGEPARIFTDGGSHSDPIKFPHNDGNVVVLSAKGEVEKVYNYENTLKNR